MNARFNGNRVTAGFAPRFLRCDGRGLGDNFANADDGWIGNFHAHSFFAARLREAVFESNQQSGVKSQRTGSSHLNLAGAVIDFDSFTNK